MNVDGRLYTTDDNDDIYWLGATFDSLANLKKNSRIILFLKIIRFSIIETGRARLMI